VAIIHVAHDQHVPCTNGQQDVPLVADIMDALGRRLMEAKPTPGMIALGALEAQSGWTFRARATNSEMRTVALLFTNYMDSDPVFVMSEFHYGWCCPERVAERKALRSFLLQTGVDIREVENPEDWVRVPVSFLRRNVEEFVKLMVGFA
jgi:hypothetical protein